MLRAARSAWLTAASLGKAAATSGSSRTRFVPARYFLTYLPRMPPFIEAKSYSGRISVSDFRLSLFIEPSLMRRCKSGADDPNPVELLAVDHHQDPAASRHIDGYEPRI